VNWKRALIAVFAAVPLIALFAYGFTRDPGEIPSPLPGREAPSFALEVFAPGESPLTRAVGDTISLPELAGKVTVMNFWASWCLACRDEHVALSETARQYADAPTQFVGVLYNDRPALGRRWIAEMGGQSYPSVTDAQSRTAIDYGLYGVPETFIIDPGGRIAYKHIGPISATVLRTWIDSLLPSAAAPDRTAGDTAVRLVPR
jgi:cytochrome c biogenesis protein CcmG/thiol:disulfide interchange protein DsbE